jgi:2OG-Fe(II) oxygenase superfamily
LHSKVQNSAGAYFYSRTNSNPFIALERNPDMQPNPYRREQSTVNLNTPIKTSQNLILADLLDLLQGKFLALRILNYYSLQQAEEITQELVKQQSLERYLRAPDVGVQRTGITFFETNGSIELLERYYEQAQILIKSLRQVCYPYLSPIDKLRLDLTDMWLAGSGIENIHGRTMLAGIARVFEDGFELPPHQDILLRDILDAALAPTHHFEDLITQLSINVYLQIPEVGGELEIWDLKPSLDEQQAIRNEEYKYEGIIDRTSLPAAAAVIRPEAGELILFDSGRIHAVRSSRGGLRASVSMFLGYRGLDKPLTYWS